MLRVDEDVINTLEVEEAEVEEEEKPAVQTLEEGRQIDGLKFKKKKQRFSDRRISLWFIVVVYLPCPSSNLLYSVISISRRVLTSSSILYSWLCFSMSARRHISCSSSCVTCTWRPWSTVAYRVSVSANVISRDDFCTRHRKERGG